jgi:class 3 adenylate cyclase
MPSIPHCPSCNFDNPPGMKFCGNCGTRLPEAPEGTPGKRPDTRPITLAQQLGAMVGADLSERFRQAGLEANGQRRNVTILFADLSGFTNLSTHTDSEDLYNFIQEFVTILANNVYKYEGMVDKFTGAFWRADYARKQCRIGHSGGVGYAR